ncbi:MAG: N-acetyl sugar amidotransferase [Candidatus Lokiarchaeota archaeon]|nr:N-acetyl sugar amidotransferase [Candidatus Lokiarchaeota archaeon]
MIETKQEYRICTRGIWDTTVPGITFDENGVSNYAKMFDKLCEEYPRGEKGKKQWENIVDKIKEKGKGKKYDCIIGVSGGTDSSYLMHIAKKEYNLRPLAVNLDNGWNSDIAVKNIKSMTNTLKIDLETYVINYEEVADLIKCYMLAGLPWIDIPADLAIKSVLYKVAARERISYVLRGNDFRSEGSQPTEWTYGDGRQLKYLHKKYGKVKLKTFPNYTLLNLLYYGFIKKIKSIYPFYYLDYNKNKAQKFLSEKYGWEYYGGHHYENIFTKFSISYWLYEKFGIDKRKITLSAQVLSNEISRDFALNEIKKVPHDNNTINQTISYICKKINITQDEFQKLMNSENHSFTDYPSYDFLFSKFLKYMKPFLKLVFIHKPQSIFQVEMRKKNSK